MHVARLFTMNTIAKIAVLLIMGILFCMQFVLAANDTINYNSRTLPFDPLTGSISEPIGLGGVSESISTIYLGSQDPLTVTIRIINIVLTFLGTAFLILLLYAGFLWVAARGNAEQIEKAKTLIIRALIGFVITLSAMGIAMLVFVVTATYTSSMTPSAIVPNI